MEGIATVLEDDEGVLWFATEDGIVRYKRRSITPEVQVVQVVADKKYEMPQDIIYSNNVGNITIAFKGRNL